ncbi:MAG: tetratricopeptide repeat protein [Candidatus Eisenbacteria bacterium]|nr:tetratricopeptide repeat protein [Candidatus Eisenbacteria bacterium]
MLTLVTLASSCAYYNTFFLARRYYFKATNGAPYELERQPGASVQNYARSIDYSKKVLGQYSKSKWVDDAYLMWAKNLIGRDDPLQTVTMLQNYASQFPKSELKPEAEFYLGLAYRNARKYGPAVAAFDNFLTQVNKHPLLPYAHYERSRALMSMQRYSEAAEAAGQVLARWPKHLLADRALRQRAEARLQQGDYAGAREDFRTIGRRAITDNDRFDFFMREVDCLESAREYDQQLALLRNELSHTPPPAPVQQGQLPAAGSDKFGRLTMRVGTAHLLAGRFDEAVAEYRKVLVDYPKTAIAAEAQYRIGYAYETVADDFDRAGQEYALVKEQFGMSNFTQQAQTRADDLGRIVQYRKGSGADSLERKAEAGFLTAERFLFQLNRPDRAIEEYASVVSEYPKTAAAGRALNAQAWVLRRKLDRSAAADSLLWRVIREYPATEAQIAARDYLEGAGHTVPESLIQYPVPKAPVVDTAQVLTPIPATPPLQLTPGFLSPEDSVAAMQRRARMTPLPGDSAMMREMRRTYPEDPRFGGARDSLGRPVNPYPPRGIPPADTTRRTDNR